MVEWLPVFTTTACCDIIVRSLEYCRAHNGLAIYAWVLLDNHLHAILASPDLSAVLRDLKSFTAKQLVQQIKVERREWLLNQLRYYRAAHKPNEYQLWQEGSHPQRILHDEMIEQKRTYLHNNPVKRCTYCGKEHPAEAEVCSLAGLVPPASFASALVVSLAIVVY